MVEFAKKNCPTEEEALMDSLHLEEKAPGIDGTQFTSRLTTVFISKPTC
jgi:hypothetical protein